jgi:hypothetical protein
LIGGHAINTDNDITRNFIDVRERIVKYAKFFRNRKPRAYLAYVTTGTTPKGDSNFMEKERVVRERLLGTGILETVTVDLLGADELQNLNRTSQNAITRTIHFPRKVSLPPVENVPQSYLGVLPLTEFYKLITGEKDKILSSIFYDNVRDYERINEVNTGMASSLADEISRERFVLMNNGVTIIAQRVISTGEPLTLENYQIVNGCQTSHVLWEKRNSLTAADVHVPVKIVATDNAVVIADIIRATNSQTNVSRLQLLAVTEFQKTLEDCFNSYIGLGLKYERRSQQYAGSILDRSKVVSQLSLIKAFASVYGESPHLMARGFKTVLKQVGESIFLPDHKPDIYVYVAALCHSIEQLLRKKQIDRQLGICRYHIAMTFHHMQKDLPSTGLNTSSMQKYCAKKIELLHDLVAAEMLLRPAILMVQTGLIDKGRGASRNAPLTKLLLENAKASS